ncbi:exostosin-like 3 [Lineus longissimus]|uniref:exostosin-like 3 n=1 Tax=Lineus longissimus TaxID=88925 RepID=UPI002B4F7B07
MAAPNGKTSWLRTFGCKRWLWSSCMTRLIVALFFVLILVPLVTHYYLGNIGSDNVSVSHRSRIKLDHVEDPQMMKVSDLIYRIEELKRIRGSVNNELRELESKRQKLHAELSTYNMQLDSLRNDYEKSQKSLSKLKLTLENTKVIQLEMARKLMPDVAAPMKILPSDQDSMTLPMPNLSFGCKMYNCFDYSRCSVTSGFPVFFYNPEDYPLLKSEIEDFVKNSVMHALNSSPHVTYDAHIACLYVVILGDTIGVRTTPEYLEQKLRSLPYWRGDGRNHVILNLSNRYDGTDIFEHVNTGRAMIAQSVFSSSRYRDKFDLVVPPLLGIAHGTVWEELPLLLPIRRKYLFSFNGSFRHLGRTGSLQGGDLEKSRLRFIPYSKSRTSGGLIPGVITDENFIVDYLKKIPISHPQDGVLFHFDCNTNSEVVPSLNAEWALCGPESERYDLLKQSTFNLILAPVNNSVISTLTFQTRLFEALKFGSIPVILGQQVALPYEEIIRWDKATITFPKARVTELHFLMRTYTENDIFAMRQQGRMIWQTYMGTTKSIVDTILAIVRTRLQIPPLPLQNEPAPSVFNASFVPLKVEPSDIEPETDDILGPLEPPLASEAFRRNFTSRFDWFNKPGDPFHLFPYTPFEHTLPSEAKFQGSEHGFRPINKGLGGAGKEFNEALGGNVPREQFTLVMLTYEREAVLINALQRLKGLPHLNKVIVVWNSPGLPAEDLQWPDIGVEIHVVRTKKNSLNNRFLPYEVIETEAILSVDDDAHLRHDEIMFGFRVWREARDRLVGFPGRYHAYDIKSNSWFYNSNYSCELSMVLTGAAFFHKYYAYLYSYIMPQAIRDKVDEYMNCEDLAMNFLISHITRKPPIKVTSRWTFRCPGCPKALSFDDSHFQERHKCMNFFVKVYGYMPLLYTQFRVDSILFKTRIPHDKQKCFKFI